jgi:hypothetical protein
MRDYNIVLSYNREISLNTKIVKSKKVYSRKQDSKPCYRDQLRDDTYDFYDDLDKEYFPHWEPGLGMNR